MRNVLVQSQGVTLSGIIVVIRQFEPSSNSTSKKCYLPFAECREDSCSWSLFGFYWESYRGGWYSLVSAAFTYRSACLCKVGSIGVINKNNQIYYNQPSLPNPHILSLSLLSLPFIYECMIVSSKLLISMSELSNDLNEEVAYQKERAQKAEAQLESHKRESKELQQFLQSESLKKQAQIRKLKEQSIIKEKQYKTQKNQLIQLLSQHSHLKATLIATQQELANSKIALGSKSESSGELKVVEGENEKLKQMMEGLSVELQIVQEKLKGAQQLNRTLYGEWEQKEKIMREEIQMGKSVADQLKKYNHVLNQKLAHYSKHQSPSPSKQPMQVSSSVVNKQTESDGKVVKELEEKIKYLQDVNRRLEQALKEKEYKHKELISQIDLLQARQSQPNLNINLTQSSSFPSPFTLKSSEQQADFSSSVGHMTYSCLLLTKPHYISPFLQVYQDKHLVKIYKSTRSGCFQKSMGFYRHKFDHLSFEQQQIIDPIINQVISSQETTHHSIVIYGAKRCSKKEIFSKVLVKLKYFITAKLENTFDTQAVYISHGQEQEEKYFEKGNNKNSILQIMDKIIALGYKNDKASNKTNVSPTKKGQIRPKIRYFSFASSNFFLEIATSSFTSSGFSQKMSTVSMLNNMLYSKLPDILQSAISQKYLILALNPIVDLYEQCRNTLSTTFCRYYTPKDESPKWKNSPIKEELNEIARKKIDHIERQNEQSLLKTHKLQDQCLYYKARFDQLQFRLKNLLNTHSGQNLYLKKSPVTLSYEKLLKFVHNVQSQRPSSSSLFKNNTIYIQKESQSVDAL